MVTDELNGIEYFDTQEDAKKYAEETGYRILKYKDFDNKFFISFIDKNVKFFFF